MEPCGFDNKTVAENYDRVLVSGKFVPHREQFWLNHSSAPLVAVVDRLIAFFGSADCIRIVDIGCGTGSDMVRLPILVRRHGYMGYVRTIGCDLSPEMVKYSRSKGLHVLEGDYRDLMPQLGCGELVWANLSLIHTPCSRINEALDKLSRLIAPGGILGIGVKTGGDEERLDAGDETIPIGRATSFFRIASVRTWLKELGLQWLTSVESPASDPSYTYGWLVMRKPPQ